MLRAGRRDRQVIIKRFTTTENVVGAPEKVESTYATVWAAKIPMSGNEAVQLERETSTEIAGWEMLFDSAVTPKDWLEVDGKAWDILYIREVGREEGMIITAEARA